MHIKSLLIIVTAALIAACGDWQLRGTQTDTEALPRITVTSDNTYSPLARSVKEAIEKHSDATDDAAHYVLQLLEEDIEKRPVTYTASGTPAQYEMTLTVAYAIHRSDGSQPGLPRTTSTHRIFDFDARNVVAKSEEERALLQQMRQQLAQRIVYEVSREFSRSRRPEDTATQDD